MHTKWTPFLLEITISLVPGHKHAKMNGLMIGNQLLWPFFLAIRAGQLLSSSEEESLGSLFF